MDISRRAGIPDFEANPDGAAGAFMPNSALVGRSLLTSRRECVKTGKLGAAGAFTLPTAIVPSTAVQWMKEPNGPLNRARTSLPVDRQLVRPAGSRSTVPPTGWCSISKIWVLGRGADRGACGQLGGEPGFQAALPVKCGNGRHANSNPGMPNAGRSIRTPTYILSGTGSG